MKRLVYSLLAAVSALGLATSASAISVGLQPSSPSIAPGGNVSLSIVISGLGNLAAPSLGAFNLALSYNAAVLTATAVSFGNQLDLGGGSIQSTDLSTAGVVLLDEVSFEASATLIASQPDTFTLATVSFTGVAGGVSPIAFTLVDLSDELGQSLLAEGVPGSVTVASASVPDVASTCALMLLGCLSLLPVARRSLALQRR